MVGVLYGVRSCRLLVFVVLVAFRVCGVSAGVFGSVFVCGCVVLV